MRSIMKCATVLAAGLALMGMAQPSSEQASASGLVLSYEVLEALDSKDSAIADLATAILHGYGVGIQIANADDSRDGQRAHYCGPATLDMTAQLHVEIFRSYLKANPDLDTYPAAMVMMIALKEKYPCE